VTTDDDEPKGPGAGDAGDQAADSADKKADGFAQVGDALDSAKVVPFKSVRDLPAPKAPAKTAPEKGKGKAKGKAKKEAAPAGDAAPPEAPDPEPERPKPESAQPAATSAAADAKPADRGEADLPKHHGQLIRNAAHWTPPKRRDDGLPEGCPVRPLGVNGGIYYYLDELKQLIALKTNQHGQLYMIGLFGRRNHLVYAFWPKWDKDGVLNGWNTATAQQTLMRACSTKGIYNAQERQRGRGAWKGEAGELILHCGDAIWQGPKPDPDVTPRGPAAGGTWHPPGLVGRYVYPAQEAGPTPEFDQPAGPEPAAELLHLLASWNWRRGETDARLLLGWIGAAVLGGALDWRPLAWLSGGPGTGKSTLQKVISYVLDDDPLSVSDTTAAGIWQKLGHQTRPVALDEVEADEDNRKLTNVVKLARQAASGGVVLRGGQDHQGSEFVARSCFLFSSILIPPLMGQDLSRMAILELQQFEADAKPPKLDAARLRSIGRTLRRRLVDGWARFPDALEAYRAQLAFLGHASRGCDQFGTLLACAEVILHDLPIEGERISEWTRQLTAGALAAWNDEQPDELRCLNHILASPCELYRAGERLTVGEWAQRAWDDLIAGRWTDAEEPMRALGRVGVRVEVAPTPRKGEQEPPAWLIVASNHKGLAAVFEGTHWAAKSGASSVWSQSLGRLDRAERTGAKYFGGVTARATAIPCDVAFPAGRKPRPAVSQDSSGQGSAL
jgi:hypothetical protein